MSRRSDRRRSSHGQHASSKKTARPTYVENGSIEDVIGASFVGTLDVSRNYAFLNTDSKRLANDIFVPKEKLHGAHAGDKVVVRVTEWAERAKNPTGEVIDILGAPGDNTVEMHAILAEFGLPYKYPQAVEEAADRIEPEITGQAKYREDFREVTTFTIDPIDAKDFDDAISIRQLTAGQWEVGVHIADVSHYVSEGGIIDKEAYKRATSVYLVDRTVPMLPERLCNYICSLRPDEEKLTYSAIFNLDSEARVLSHRIGRTIIKSNRRFTYEEAQERIETCKGDYTSEILQLNDLAKKLRERRFDNGAINFDRVEVRFDIDESGKPLSVYFKESKDAHKLVEEFMLLANRTVAEHIGKVPRGVKAKVFPYRIHEQPDPDKLADLTKLVARFGYKLKSSPNNAKKTSQSINRLLGEVQNKPEQNLIETVAIRSMAKARYSINNVGHYGLAFDYYTHFTSPIRRYPDLLVHRLLARYDSGGRSVSATRYEELCDHSSAMEQLAAQAERQSIKYKQVEYMREHLGEEYSGIISGVTEWGFYVELDENKCEGMVSMRSLQDDYYTFDEKNFCLRGRRSGNVYTLGSPVTVKVARANLERKQLDFTLVHE